MRRPVFWLRWLCALGCMSVLWAGATEEVEGVPLVYNQRVIHHFRTALGPYTPQERAEGALRRLKEALHQPGGDGWVLVRPLPQGLQVELDGKALFLVLADDAQTLAGETPEGLAQQAARNLRTVWKEARERRDTKAIAVAVGRALLAAAGFLLAAVLLLHGSKYLRQTLTVRLNRALSSRHLEKVLPHVTAVLPALITRGVRLFVWLMVLALFFVFLTYSLGLFAATRATSEALASSILALVEGVFGSFLQALPGLFLAALIFLLTWLVTQISSDFFASLESRPSDRLALNAHTAPMTRRLVNALLWLFALAMAYPYLPGSQTEAFKGLSVFVGLMVSIGASGVVGQIASGVMIVYTFSLKKGEYVRIQDYEGTVTDLGLFVTRLRTGLGEEVALPNAFVLANVTRNFSRVNGGKGYVLDTSVTIGYDTPWRQVHALLLEAADAVPLILQDPVPYVVQVALSDFYVQYKLVVYVNTEVPSVRAQVASGLHAAIQDAFNRHGVQIMSPHYLGDPAQAKMVPPSAWFATPAKPPGPSA